MTADIRAAFVGDSFTAGVEDDQALGWVGRVVVRARSAGWNLTGYNLGVRRETTVDVGDRLLAEGRRRLRDGDAHGLVVSTGINDTTVLDGQRRVEPAGTLAALSRIIELAAGEGWPLLFVGPALVDDEQQNERIVALSAQMAERCRNHGSPTSRSLRRWSGTRCGSPRWQRSTARTRERRGTNGSRAWHGAASSTGCSTSPDDVHGRL